MSMDNIEYDANECDANELRQGGHSVSISELNLIRILCVPVASMSAQHM